MIKPKIVLIGGGTGSFTLLQELKNWTPDITAVVNMCDDGGSSGELRDELGVLPPGDIRQCLVALSNNSAARDLFAYRFGKGKLHGHAVGNLILSALELQTGSFAKAVKIVADFMQITGKVIPVSDRNYVLVMQDGDHLIRGEHKISQHKILKDDARIFLDPKVHINPEAKEAILQADLVVIAPGNLYSSLLPSLATVGMAKTLQETKAQVVMVANLVNKPLQTYNWHVVDYLKQIERYVGNGSIDVLLYNTQLPSKNLLSKYAQNNELPVVTTKSRFQTVATPAIGVNLVSKKIFKPDPHDKLIQRTFIRHDAIAVRKQLERIINRHKH